MRFASRCQPGFQAAWQRAGCEPAEAVSSALSPKEHPASAATSATGIRSLHTGSTVALLQKEQRVCRRVLVGQRRHAVERDAAVIAVEDPLAEIRSRRVLRSDLLPALREERLRGRGTLGRDED